jgi:hypothetical protein
MTAKETLEKHYTNHKKRIGYPNNVFQAMKDYARQKCEEQRKICSEKGIVFTDAYGDQAVITGGDYILNAPEPSFD